MRRQGGPKKTPAQLLFAHLRSSWSKDSMAAAEFTKNACACPFGSCWSCQTNARVTAQFSPANFASYAYPGRPPLGSVHPLIILAVIGRAPIPVRPSSDPCLRLHAPGLFHFQLRATQNSKMQGLWRTQKYVNPRRRALRSLRVRVRVANVAACSSPHAQTLFLRGINSPWSLASACSNSAKICNFLSHVFLGPCRHHARWFVGPRSVRKGEEGKGRKGGDGLSVGPVDW